MLFHLFIFFFFFKIKVFLVIPLWFCYSTFKKKSTLEKYEQWEICNISFWVFFSLCLKNKLQISYVEKFFLKLIKSVTFHNGWYEESPQVQYSVVHSLGSQGL